MALTWRVFVAELSYCILQLLLFVPSSDLALIYASICP